MYTDEKRETIKHMTTMQWWLFFNESFMCVFVFVSDKRHTGSILLFLFQLIQFKFLVSEVDFGKKWGATLLIKWLRENMQYTAVTVHESCKPNL